MQQSSDCVIQNAAGETHDVGQSRRLRDSPEMGLRTAWGLLLAGPAAAILWDQCCWVAAEPCAAPISLSSCLWHFWFGAHSCRVELASLAVILEFPYMAGIAASQLGISYLLCPCTLTVHIFNELAPTASPPVCKVWFHLGSSGPCGIDLRVGEHKETICVLNSRVFGAGRIC